MFQDLVPQDNSYDKFELKDHLGKVLVLRAFQLDPEVKTKFGLKEMVKADIFLLNEDGTTANVFHNCYVAAGYLVGAAKRAMDANNGVGWLGGRVGQKPTDKGNPAWVLENKGINDTLDAAAKAIIEAHAPKSPFN